MVPSFQHGHTMVWSTCAACQEHAGDPGDGDSPVKKPQPGASRSGGTPGVGGLEGWHGPDEAQSIACAPTSNVTRSANHKPGDRAGRTW